MNLSEGSKLNQLNRTELYQMCQHAGFNVYPNLTREQFIGILCGDLELPSGYGKDHPIDQWRTGRTVGLHTTISQLRFEYTVCALDRQERWPESDPQTVFLDNPIIMLQ